MLEPLFRQLARQARRHLAARLGHHLAGLGVDQIAHQLDAAHAAGVEGRLPTLVGQAVGDGVVEEIEHLFRRHADDLVRLEGLLFRLALLAQRHGGNAVERHQQGRRRQLAAAVDPHVDQVLGVELEVEPGAAVGDDPRGEQELARGVGLAAVVIEEHPGAAVHLADDDALGAVDDEGAVGRHQRHVAHVDILFLDVADRARAGVLVDVPHHQPQGHLEWGRVGDAALLAFLDVVFRLFQLVVHELELGTLGEVSNRKHRVEHLLQAEFLAVLDLGVHLQELVVGGFLHFDQVRHPGDFRNAPEILANALATSERLRHFASSSASSSHRRAGPCISPPGGITPGEIRSQKTVPARHLAAPAGLPNHRSSTSYTVRPQPISVRPWLPRLRVWP